MFAKDIGIDLGTANVLIYIKCHRNRMQKEKHNGSINKYTKKHPGFQVHAYRKF